MVLSTSEDVVSVAALYRFMEIADPAALRAALFDFCREQGLKGSLLLAPEGVNGTVAGSEEGIGGLIGFLEELPGFHGAEIKFSHAVTMPFRRMKVRLKKEIVTMGVSDIDPVHNAGIYVTPGEWNRLIADPETILIDTRNVYEVAIGTFSGAINPETENFREFPSWVDGNSERFRGRKVAMFCTGGIRCEKASAYVRSAGVKEVFHLRGGILKYLEEVPEEESLWQGECFVFDERVSVRHGLKAGNAKLCPDCGRPSRGAVVAASSGGSGCCACQTSE
ncbi:MAG TPA: rhodanese-related sulfurtransferase [Rhizobiaceae bacterium]|nr:rhodanese-related sulfurtransferase [Rhizobiaceae bacterium]